MLRDEVADRLWENYEHGGYLFPAYEDYCIGNVPDTTRMVFDLPAGRPLPGDVLEGVGEGIENVVLVVVDGFGLDAWRDTRERNAVIDRLTEAATVTPLTSIYPSETAAAITTLETGQLPCEHGRIGWNVYEPGTDRSFLALDGTIKSGAGESPAEEAFEGVEFMYDELASSGVDCHRYQPFPADTSGVTQHTYERLEEFGSGLASILESAVSPVYLYGYLPHIDHVAHDVGTEADRYWETVASVAEQLAVFGESLDEATAEATLLLVLADHGHVNTDPDRNIDISKLAPITDALQKQADGTPVKLAGSPRNVHLHLQDGTIESARKPLTELDARTVTREAALEMGLFGDRNPSDHFRRRCGDLVLTHRRLGTWFGDIEPKELSLVGMHGGLHPHEMLVPFAAIRADRAASS